MEKYENPIGFREILTHINHPYVEDMSYKSFERISLNAWNKYSNDRQKMANHILNGVIRSLNRTYKLNDSDREIIRNYESWLTFKLENCSKLKLIDWVIDLK